MMAERPFRIPLATAPKLDIRYRRGAAMLALVFPLVPVILLILGLAKNGVGSLPTHPLLVASVPTGFAALVYWVKRYSNPAVTALRNKGHPVTVDAESVEFFGRTFPLSAASSLSVQGKMVSLVNGDHVLAMEPTFFVKSDAWR